MWPRMVVLRASALAVALLLAACGEPLRPADLAGIYSLRRIGQDEAPATDSAGGLTSVVDTIIFDTDGTGRHVRITVFAPHASSLPDTMTWDVPLVYRARRGRFELTFDCPPNALCAAGPHWLIYPNALGFTGIPLDSRGPLYYERVGPAP